MLAVLAVVVLGCAQGEDASPLPNAQIRGVEIAGDFGTRPVARIATPLRLGASATQQVILGTGPAVQIDQLFVVQLTVFNARTGAQVASTLDPGGQPQVAKTSDDTLFPVLVDALARSTQGSRVVAALTSADAFGRGGVPPVGVEPADPVVVVADVLAVPPAQTVPVAEGSIRSAPAGSPRIELLADEPTRVETAGLAEPPRLEVIELVTGAGPPVRSGSLVTLDFLGQEWGTRLPFVDTFFKDPIVFPVAAEGSLAAWDRALVGRRAGSRLLVLDPDPPNQVPGETKSRDHGTIAWVVDVLGAS